MLTTLLMDRRRLLLGLAAASTAAAAPIATLATAPAESPALLALAERLEAAAAETAAARAHKQAVVSDWWGKWPTAPAEICEGFNRSYGAHGEQGLTGAQILSNGHPVPNAPSRASADQWRAYLAACNANPEAYHSRVVGTSARFATRRDDCLKAIDRKRPRHPLSPAEIAELQAMAADYSEKAVLAAAYEGSCERVREASGYREAVDRDNAAFQALAAIVAEIIATPAETVAGVIIKAQALAAWEAEPAHIFHVASWNWPGAFAAEVIRIASGSVTK